MFKQKIITSIFLSFFLFSSVSSTVSADSTDSGSADQGTFVGIKKSRTAKILDNFNEQQQVLLFDNVPFSSGDDLSLFNTERKLNSLGDILNRIENTKSQYKEKKALVTKQKITLKNTISELDQSIAESEKSIADQEDAIADKNKKIAEYAAHITELEAKIADNKQAILKYLAYIYKKGDLVYSDTQNIDLIRSIILNDGDLSDIFNDIHYKSILEIAGQNFIELHRSLVKEYYYNKESLKKEKLDELRLKSELVAKNRDLTAQKEYKEQLLEVTRGQEALFNKYIADKQQHEEDISARLTNVTQEYEGIFAKIGDKYKCDINAGSGTLDSSGATASGSEASQSCTDLQKYYASEKKLLDYQFDDSVQNKFAWPVQATRVSTYYHDEEYFAALGSQHEAVDLPMPQGSDIVAPAGGYVYFISAPAPGKYSYVALKHANGFVTVYGHVSEILVNKFDFVEPGQVFARTGGAPGTPGAGIMTSGAHLHFEVYLNRASVDPLRYLDLTHLRYESLDAKYKYKFIDDVKARYGARANLSKYTTTFTILGNSEIERQKYLLDNYASANFDNWDMWTEEAVSGKIDPSFLMCVGLAETGLGNHLKTGYNVGNIGNTDSGGTYQFASPRDGVYWMAKTLNNKFLGKYQGINELSRWGNKTGSIYASSSQNWHNNVVRCLSALKGRFVEDDYKFRLADGNDE